jgi:Pyruvate/2-oxoacid:ferredoxin oxidoreductase delta subunit
VAMEGNGPRNGNPSQVGAVILSVDPVAADAAAAFLVGVDPCLIRTTRLAATQKLGQADLTKIDCCLIQPGEHGLAVQRGPAGELLEPHRRLDFKATLNWQSFMALLGVISTPLLKRFILNRPVIDEQMCTRCACCTWSCPLDPKAIRQPIDDTVPSYDYARCIRCYCCQEVCPSGAISVRRTLIGKILHT